MKLLLDQGLPRGVASELRALGFEAVHASEVGLSRADDDVILEQAGQAGQVVVTLDADFHALVATSGSTTPSVVWLRIEGLKAEPAARLVSDVVRRCRADIEAGALITVRRGGLKLRRLPIQKG
ncbi:MAG: DUF5615 family PIN-like protein [Phycisphaerae bacterium]